MSVTVYVRVANVDVVCNSEDKREHDWFPTSVRMVRNVTIVFRRVNYCSISDNILHVYFTYTYVCIFKHLTAASLRSRYDV